MTQQQYDEWALKKKEELGLNDVDQIELGILLGMIYGGAEVCNLDPTTIVKAVRYCADLLEKCAEVES